MASSELNTVLRRNASGLQVRGGIQKGAMTLGRRVPRETKEALIAPVAGFSSAAIEISAVWPFEYAKTQLQLNKANPDFKVVEHMRERGFGIYRGLAPLLIGAPIQGLLRFTTLDYFNQRLKDPETGKISVASGLIAGLAAGVLESVIVVAPMETVKTRLIHANKGLVEGVKYVVARDGFKGLYKGLGATIAKSASNQGLRFVIFNQYKNMVLSNPQTDKLTGVQALAGGMIAGCLGCLANTPLDTIKSRMQSMDAHKYRNVVHCAQTMVKEEGPLSLYKGLLPRLGRVLPGQGIIFFSYEMISNKLRAQI